ncbi:MAG: DNA polymerase IV [Verrucomicrobia bacterium]|nr:DNA polymerase IV [Verrucomicrobiota bacterium]
MPAFARVLFHVDMDAFFAAIEQRDRPELRGKPVIVGAPPNRRGVVATASYEARRFGVKSAMPSVTAGRLCPQGIFVKPRIDVYRAESHHIMAILADYTPLVEQVSVDEAYLDVSACVREPDPLVAIPASRRLARELKQRIFIERGLTASIGVASNKFLSKVGSDFQKPDGLTLIPEQEKRAFLRPLPVRAIPGIGPVSAARLLEFSFQTIGDIQDSTPERLRAAVGSFAERLHALACGEDDRELCFESERKSISSEHTFDVDTNDPQLIRATLLDLVADVAGTLQRKNLTASTLQVKVRYADFTTLTRQTTLQEPVCDAAEIYRAIRHLLKKEKLLKGHIRLLGVGSSNLNEPSGQMNLFLGNQPSAK